ncbi:MAG: DUF2332 domain-containing protein [Acidimicrobiia bacterium]
MSGVQEARTALAEWFRLEAVGIGEIGSPFYAELERRMADDVETGGPTWELLESRADAPTEHAVALRLLGGVHRMVLSGTAPELARHYPSTGGDGDAAAAWWHFRDLVTRAPAEVLDALTRPPQTNEVGRSASLVPGFLEVAAKTALPLRLLELGSSAGLNLRVDRYCYEHDGLRWGDPGSPVRFVDLWSGDRPPPLGTPATIAARSGCDRDPIDPADPDSVLTLLSYVWPDQAERLQRLRAALEIAAGFPVEVARAPIEDWLPQQLDTPVPGVATVVFHSVVWQYLPDATRAIVLAALDEAGGRATGDAPLAYLRLEPAVGTYFPAQLRLTTWPGGSTASEGHLLATSGFHFGPVTWLG